MQCDKCLTVLPEGNYVQYAIPLVDKMEKVSLCLRCNSIYDNRAFLLIEFLKEDYGQFPVGEIDKRMIEARKLRSQGKGPWQVKRDLCDA